MVDGLRLALTTLTVAPVRPGRIDRTVAGVAISLAPAVGALIGLVQAAVLLGLRQLDAPPLLVGVVTVAVGVGLTRGLHLDGLADTADALASYRDPAGALTIMKRSDVGPSGVIALVLTLLTQVAAIAAGLSAAAVVVAAATGRLAITWACRRGVPAARPDGLGALVAGTVRWPALFAGTAFVAALAALTGLGHEPLTVAGAGLGGPAAGFAAEAGLAALTTTTTTASIGVAVATAAAAVLGLGAALGLVRHAVRRFGGITGDVLGAACETATTVTLALLVVLT